LPWRYWGIAKGLIFGNRRSSRIRAGVAPFVLFLHNNQAEPAKVLRELGERALVA